MKTKKLKVGQSFEVVESLISEFDVTKGKQYLFDTYGDIVDESNIVFDDKNDQYTMFNGEIKRIGKLKITKLK